MNSKKFVILVTIFILLIGFGINKIIGKKSDVPSNIREQQQFAMQELSREDYDIIRDEFLKIVKNQNPKNVLADLRERLKTDDPLLRSCHALVHEIGQKAYEKYGNFSEAMKYQDEICNSGYLHGIIESHFSKSDDIFSAMKSVCNDYKLGSFISWECYHGIGHGVMYYTSNDLPRSLSMCDSFESGFARSDCANGVFMENFNTDQKLHPSKFLKQEDPFYPCHEQSARHKGECYLYAPTYFLSLNRNDYVGALRWCEGAELPHRLTCAAGVGSQAIKENINNPKFAETMCMSNTAEQVDSCINGLVSLYINHHGSLEPAKVLCELFEPRNQQTCYNTIQSKSGQFESDS